MEPALQSPSDHRAFIVFTHPSPSSYNAAIKNAVVETLHEIEAQIHLTDLYARGFDPVMQANELNNYLDPSLNQIGLEEDVQNLLWCNTLIFVYPTWCFGPPAILKGWLERCLLPGVAFEPRLGTGEEISRGLSHIKRMAVFTTCGASLSLDHSMGSPGKSIFLRGVRALLSSGCKTAFAAHYDLDTSTPISREDHLIKVDRKLRNLMS